MKSDQDNKLLTRRQVAEALQVHPRTIARWEEQELIKPVKLSARCIRYRSKDIERLVDELAE